MSNIEFVKNYSIINIAERNVLFLGGAVSIDRLNPAFECFADSPFVFDEEKLKSVRNVNMVVSHSAPKFCNPRTVSKIVESYAKNDKNLLEDLAIEREKLEKAFDILMENNELKLYAYGHYHFNSNPEIFNGVTFQLCAMGRFYKVN